MPISKRASEENKPAPEAHGRRRHRVVTVLAVLAVLTFVNVLLCLVLEPFGAHSEIVWWDYRRAEHIDTVFLGSSYAAYDIDPRPFDEALGSYSYNFGSPGQTLDNTLAALETTTADHDLKRAVLCIGYESIAGEPYLNASLAFTQSKCLGETPSQVLADAARLVCNEQFFGTKDSLFCAFPWIYNHVTYTPDAIRTNVQNRLNGDIYEASKFEAGDWQYESQGFGAIHNTLDAKNVHDQQFGAYKDVPFQEINVQSLQQICELCHQKSIALYVVAAPYIPSAVRYYGNDYVEGMSRIQAIVQEAGATYFDLNLLHRDVLDPDLSYFCDPLHLSNVGAAKVGRTLASLIRTVEAHESTEGLFYDYSEAGWQAYLDSLEFVDSIDYECTSADQGVLVKTIARTGDKTPVEYQFERYNPSREEWETVRAYDAKPEFLYTRDEADSVQIRISARSTNGKQDQARWLEDTISYEESANER